MELLEANQDKIDWIQLSADPSIFTYDHDFQKEYMSINSSKVVSYNRQDSSYKNLRKIKQIDWSSLSNNPITHLLLKNTI